MEKGRGIFGCCDAVTNNAHPNKKANFITILNRFVYNYATSLDCIEQDARTKTNWLRGCVQRRCSGTKPLDAMCDSNSGMHRRAARSPSTTTHTLWVAVWCSAARVSCVNTGSNTGSTPGVTSHTASTALRERCERCAHGQGAR